MDWQKLLFSFDGRTRRLHFWLVGIALTIVNGLVSNLTWGPAYMQMMTGQPGAWGPVALIGCLVSLALYWPFFANLVKRAHDRDMAWWWAVLMFLACFTVIGILWPLIVLGFMDGTPGPNKYGPSPKGLGGDAPAAA
jgi:uncharacterized membrane protein YhaH (DUF805 family)